MALTLEDLGWNEAFAKEFEPYLKEGWKPARLIRDNKVTFGALLEGGDQFDVVMSGRVYHEARAEADLPAVGDWVALDVGSQNGDHVIRARLGRHTWLSRKMPGRSSEEQVIASNIDVVAVVTESGPDFNLRRLERYFALIGKSGAKAVVLINKSDLFPEAQNQEAAEAIRAMHPDLDVHISCAQKRGGLKGLRSYLKKGVTVTLVGSSGVGKSSIINALFGDDYQWTDETNELTGKGRHTTTARELMVLPKGGILIDNPGIREVHMWTDENSLRERFADIEELATHCKFGDCRHGTDKGCAVRAAEAAGTLETARLESYLKLEREIAELQLTRKKRQMTLDRRTQRDERGKARRYHDRRDPDHERKHEPRHQ